MQFIVENAASSSEDLNDQIPDTVNPNNVKFDIFITIWLFYKCLVRKTNVVSLLFGHSVDWCNVECTLGYIILYLCKIYAKLLRIVDWSVVVRLIDRACFVVFFFLFTEL